MRVYLYSMAAVLLAGCGTQLPQRADGVEINRRPDFTGTYLSSNPEIGAANLLNFVGRLGIIDATGAVQFLPGRYLQSGGEITVQPVLASTAPSYRSLINDRYTLAGNFPFIQASGNSETLNEVEVRTAATASVKAEHFPGIDELMRELRRNAPWAATSIDRLVWTEGASIVTVQQRAFRRVGSASEVNGSGFGLNGITYNNREAASLVPYIGIQFRDVRRSALTPEPVAAAGGAPEAPSPTVRGGIAGIAHNAVIPLNPDGSSRMPLDAWLRPDRRVP